MVKIRTTALWALVSLFSWGALGGCEAKRPPIPEGLGIPADVAKLGQDAYYKHDCVNCHVLDGVGGKMGPSLVGIGATKDKSYIRDYIKDPQAVNRMSGMPKMPLNEAELEAVVAFIAAPR